MNLIPLYILVKSFPLCLINHRSKGPVNAHLISWPKKKKKKILEGLLPYMGVVDILVM